MLSSFIPWTGVQAVQAQLPLLPAESGVPGGFCHRHQEASGTTPPTKYNINQNLTSNNSQGISGWMTVIKPVMWIPVGCYADPDPGSASASVRSRIQKRIRSQGVKSCLKVIFLKYKYNLEISDLLKFSALFGRYSAIFNLLNPDPHHCITPELQEIKNVWRWNKIIEKHKKHCLSIL